MIIEGIIRFQYVRSELQMAYHRLRSRYYRWKIRHLLSASDDTRIF